MVRIHRKLYKKDLHDPDNHDGLITYLGSDILECEVNWALCTMEYYPAITKNAFESVLMRWMKLDLIIQSEVSKKEKYQYSILMNIYVEFRKMVTMTLYERQQKRRRCKEQSFGLYGRRRVCDVLRE